MSRLVPGLQRISIHVVLFAALGGAASAQESSWGVVAGFAPWEKTPSVEKLTNVIFDDQRHSILKGTDIRIGIVRGRMGSGDWGVSFIRKTVDIGRGDTVIQGAGCTGGSSGPNAPLVLRCTEDRTSLTPDHLRMTGVEFHKFVPVVTIWQRAQVGFNFGGGLAFGKGRLLTQTSRASYTCSFAPNSFPSPAGDDVCGGGTRSAETVVPTGPGAPEPFSYLVTYEQERIPLGKVELAGAFIAGPHVKVRVSGGLNYPGMTTFGVTGVYLFK